MKHFYVFLYKKVCIDEAIGHRDIPQATHLFITLCKVGVSCGTVYYAVQGCSNI